MRRAIPAATSTTRVRFSRPLQNRVGSSDPDFHNPKLIVDHTDADYRQPEGHIEKFYAAGVSRPLRALDGHAMIRGGLSGGSGGYYLALGKIDVYSGGKEIATLCPVTADPTYGMTTTSPR